MTTDRILTALAYALFLASAIIIGSTLLARAADFDAIITNLDGSPILDDKGKTVELTVRSVSVNALMSPSTDEPNLPGEEKLRRADLARRILSKDPSLATISSEDVALIKKLVNKNYPSPLVVEQVWRALERK